MGLKKFYILGHSFGGRIAIKFAAKYPEKIKALVLVSAVGIKQKKNLKQILLFKIASIGNKFSSCPYYSLSRKIFYKLIVGKTDYLKVSGNIKETFKKIIDEDLSFYLSQISVPVLIIWGEKDKTTPLKDGYLMKEKIKNSKIEILKGVKHTPHLETPEVLSKKVLHFLASFD
ncbi:MAG: Lipase 3 [candidate division WS2 bacterium]|nr:Lipase 3 [Candidatus Psychracetigena formicireducens]